MRKIVYNRCYGGFSISKEALDWMLNNTDDAELIKELEEDISYGYYFGEPELRCHPLLIKCIETIGASEASGGYAELAIAEIKDDELYRIDEYDGSETVETVSTYSWY